jgi:hypothetical protein
LGKNAGFPALSACFASASQPTASQSSSSGWVGSLVKTFGAKRALFGTHAPFLIPEAALLRVLEAALEENDPRAIMHGNPEALIEEERA